MARPPLLGGIAVQSDRAKRILIEPRSGGIPLAPGASPGLTRKNASSAVGAKDPLVCRPAGARIRKRHLPRAGARGYRNVAAPRLNKDAAFAATMFENSIATTSSIRTDLPSRRGLSALPPEFCTAQFLQRTVRSSQIFPYHL